MMMKIPEESLFSKPTLLDGTSYTSVEVLATKLKAEMDTKVVACDRIIKAQKDNIDQLHLEKERLAGENQNLTNELYTARLICKHCKEVTAVKGIFACGCLICCDDPDCEDNLRERLNCCINCRCADIDGTRENLDADDDDEEDDDAFVSFRI